jgi:hypothetical protein
MLQAQALEGATSTQGNEFVGELIPVEESMVEEIQRLDELLEKREAQTITRAELEELALLNDGDATLFEYLPVEQEDPVIETIETESFDPVTANAELVSDPTFDQSQDNETTLSSSDIDSPTTDLSQIITILMVLSGLVLLSLLLSTYAILRQRNVPTQDLTQQ